MNAESELASRIAPILAGTAIPPLEASWTLSYVHSNGAIRYSGEVQVDRVTARASAGTLTPADSANGITWSGIVDIRFVVRFRAIREDLVARRWEVVLGMRVPIEPDVRVTNEKLVAGAKTWFAKASPRRLPPSYSPWVDDRVNAQLTQTSGRWTIKGVPRLLSPWEGVEIPVSAVGGAFGDPCYLRGADQDYCQRFQDEYWPE